MDQWLIRTSDNWIAGPYSKEQVRVMVFESKLGLQDEVCAGNGYWIYIHEIEEVKRQLGIEVPRKTKPESGDDVTLPQSSYNGDDEVTDPDITQVKALRHPSTPQSVVDPGKSEAQPSQSAVQPSMQPSPPIQADSTAPAKKNDLVRAKDTIAPLFEVKGAAEKPSSSFRWEIWILAAVLGAVCVWLLKKTG